MRAQLAADPRQKAPRNVIAYKLEAHQFRLSHNSDDTAPTYHKRLERPNSSGGPFDHDTRRALSNRKDALDPHGRWAPSRYILFAVRLRAAGPVG
jgi:hypothetical protein